MHPSGCTALASARAHMHLRMQPLARFPLRQPFFLHVVAPFPSLCLLMPLSRPFSFSFSLDLHISIGITPSLSVLLFTPISYPP